MTWFLGLRAPRASRKELGRYRYGFELRSDRSGQALVVVSDEALDAFQLDAPQGAAFPEGTKVAEGVLIGEHQGTVRVVFIELKGTSDPAKAEQQLRSMFTFFHPTNGEGATLHEGWAAGESLPDSVPSKDHPVVGIALHRRLGTRLLPRVVELGETRCVVIHSVFHGARFNRLVQRFDELLAAVP